MQSPAAGIWVPAIKAGLFCWVSEGGREEIRISVRNTARSTTVLAVDLGHKVHAVTSEGQVQGRPVPSKNQTALSIYGEGVAELARKLDVDTEVAVVGA